MTFDINIVFNIAISMFLVMAVGYLLRKIGLIDAAFSKSLSRLVLYVTQPVLIVASMIKLKFSIENTKQLGFIFLISLFVHCLGALFGYLSMRFIKQENARKLSEHSILFLNIMFFGLPIVQAMFGDVGTAWASFFSINFHLFAWTYGLMILGRGRDDIKLSLKNVLLNCGTIPCTLGVVLYVLSFDLPAGVTTALNYIGSLCTPISLLVLGGVLSTLPFKKLFNDGRIYYVCFVKLIVFPLVVFIITKYLFGINDEMSMFAMLMAGLPTASLTNMFAELYDIEPGYAATSVGMTTAFSVATLPFVVWAAQTISQMF